MLDDEGEHNFNFDNFAPRRFSRPTTPITLRFDDFESRPKSAKRRKSTHEVKEKNLLRTRSLKTKKSILKRNRTSSRKRKSVSFLINSNRSTPEQDSKRSTPEQDTKRSTPEQDSKRSTPELDTKNNLQENSDTVVIQNDETNEEAKQIEVFEKSEIFVENEESAKKDAENTMIIMSNINFSNDKEDTAYLLAVRITNKMIEDKTYDRFGKLNFVDIVEKFDYSSITCTGYLSMVDKSLHAEVVKSLNGRVKFYGKTISMKVTDYAPRIKHSWKNPAVCVTPVLDDGSICVSYDEKPDNLCCEWISNFISRLKITEKPVIFTQPGKNETDPIIDPNIDKKSCPNCCYFCCCCRIVQLSFNSLSNAIKGITDRDKISPVNKSGKT